MEALVVLMSMEASIVASKLSIIFLHTVVKSAEAILFVRASVIARVIALVLLHRQVSILLTRNVLPGHCVVVTAKLVITFLVEVVALRIEEITAWKHVEVVRIILAWSVLDLLSRVFLHSWNRFFIQAVSHALLRHQLQRILMYDYDSGRQTGTILIEFVHLLWRWWLGLVLELTIDLTIDKTVRVVRVVRVVWVELILVNFKQVFGKPEAIVALVSNSASYDVIFVDT